MCVLYPDRECEECYNLLMYEDAVTCKLREMSIFTVKYSYESKRVKWNRKSARSWHRNRR